MEKELYAKGNQHYIFNRTSVWCSIDNIT